MVVLPDLNIMFCTYLLTDNILWVTLSTYIYYTTREPTKKTSYINGLYNRSTNTVKHGSASQTNGNFLFLVRRLNILWAINQGRNGEFVTLVFLPVLNDNDVFRKLSAIIDFLSVTKNILLHRIYIAGIVYHYNVLLSLFTERR